jgi:DNA-binding transcriptional ArsR family regulator
LAQRPFSAIVLSPVATGVHVRVEASPVYDFLAALFAVHRHGRGLQFDCPDPWVRAARRALGASCLRDLVRFAGGRALFVSLVALLERRAGPVTVPDFLRQVEALPAHELLLVLLGSSRAARPAREHLLAVLTTRGADREQALRRFAERFPEELGRPTALRLARTDPEVTRARLVRLLQRFYDAVYAAEEGRVWPLILRDAEDKRRRLGQVPAETFVEEATGGWVADPATAPEVVVAPSWYVRPYLLVADHVGTRTYVVPVADPSRAEDPGERLLRVARALADETRLRIVRMLARQEMYVQQVAEALGTSHVTALHHLATLRAAGLVRVVERRNLRYYQLRPEALEEAARGLESLKTAAKAPGGR